MPLSEAWKAILNQPVLIHLTTLNDDGSPSTSPVWVAVDGDDLIVNSAVGRLKDKNVRRDPRVAFSAVDPTNPYHALMVQGRVTEISVPRAPTRRSMRWPRNTSARTNIRSAGRARCA